MGGSDPSPQAGFPVHRRLESKLGAPSETVVVIETSTLLFSDVLAGPFHTSSDYHVADISSKICI